MRRVLIKLGVSGRIAATVKTLGETGRVSFSSIMEQESFGLLVKEIYSGSLSMIECESKFEFNFYYEPSTVSLEFPSKHQGMATVSWTVNGDLKCLQD